MHLIDLGKATARWEVFFGAIRKDAGLVRNRISRKVERISVVN